MLTVIANLKGGVGKSTLAFNLAVWLFDSDRKVVLFDLDPQKTLTDAIEVRSVEGFEPELTAYDSIDDLQRLARHKSSLDILVDTGGSTLDVTYHAIALADRVLIPVQPSQADIWSTQRFIRMIEEHTDGNSPELLAFVNRADTHYAVTETDEAEEALKQLPGIKTLTQRLYQRTAYRRSFTEGLAVFEMGPLSKAGQEMLHLANVLYRDPDRL
ncbi:MAG: ParA family protein [Gammaproteobacteria bacterium]|nr:ParA family protein [Gammaproteobacteria bacterium]